MFSIPWWLIRSANGPNSKSIVWHYKKRLCPLVSKTHCPRPHELSSKHQQWKIQIFAKSSKIHISSEYPITHVVFMLEASLEDKTIGLEAKCSFFIQKISITRYTSSLPWTGAKLRTQKYQCVWWVGEGYGLLSICTERSSQPGFTPISRAEISHQRNVGNRRDTSIFNRKGNLPKVSLGDASRI